LKTFAIFAAGKVKNKFSMAHIYWDKREIPIPEGAHINSNDGRVFIFLREGKVLEKSRRSVIGRATSKTTMHPNETFRQTFPALWKEYYGEDEFIKERQLNSGMYATCLGLSYKTGIYGLLLKSFGPLYANAIIDYAMYSNLTKSNVAMTFAERMASEVVFSKNLPNDTWLSEMFTSKMNRNQRMSFCDGWLQSCKDRGDTEAWISIDGSNDDCESEGCDLAEKGKAKSGSDSNVVYFIYAVSAETGLPLTYRVLNGGMVDAKAINDIIADLSSHGVTTRGLLLDRGLCASGVFSEIDKVGYPYIVMLKSNTYSHCKMLEEASEDIRWNVDHIVSRNSVFGISSQRKRRIFKHFDNEAFINLFFDGGNASDRSMTLIRKVLDTTSNLRDKIERGEDAAVPVHMQQYVSIVESDGRKMVEIDRKQWQKSINSKGFYSMASDSNYGAEFVHRHYFLRDASEKVYAEIKTQLGYDVLRTHSTESVENRLFVCFVAAVIRSEIMQASVAAGIPTNQMVKEIDRIHLFLNHSDIYVAIHDESDRQKAFLKYFGVLPSDFDSIAADVNGRNAAIVSQERKLERIDAIKAELEKQEKKAHKKGPGRPKGSKTKRNEVSDTAPDNKVPDVPKGKPGRRKGSKNRKTLEKEATAAASKSVVQEEKRKPGRPKGSLNKKTIERLKQNRRGRPIGSKNKK